MQSDNRTASSNAQIPKELRKRITRVLFLYVFVPYASVVGIFAVFQRQLMYQPTVANDLSVATTGFDSQTACDVQIHSDDGTTLRGWLLSNNKTSDNIHRSSPLLICFPGNSLNRQQRIDDLHRLSTRGFDVLIFDYRGFGDSTGHPSEAALSSDARLIWNFACEGLQYDEQKIVLFGESLGGAVVLSLWS